MDLRNPITKTRMVYMIRPKTDFFKSVCLPMCPEEVQIEMTEINPIMLYTCQNTEENLGVLQQQSDKEYRFIPFT